MRRMYSENQLISLIQKTIGLGGHLYKHTLTLKTYPSFKRITIAYADGEISVASGSYSYAQKTIIVYTFDEKPIDKDHVIHAINDGLKAEGVFDTGTYPLGNCFTASGDNNYIVQANTTSETATTLRVISFNTADVVDVVTKMI